MRLVKNRRSPRLGLLYQKIGCKTGKDYATRLQLITFVASASQRQVEIMIPTDIAALLHAKLLVLPIYIAMFTARTDFYTSVPRIPIGTGIRFFTDKCYVAFCLFVAHAVLH